MNGPVVYTIGHSNRAIETFLDLLSRNGIEGLVDIRTVPKSRHNPQFETGQLASSLARAGIHYTHEPRLGGLRHPRPGSPNTGWRNSSFRGYADYMSTDTFHEGLAALLEIAARERTAIMCAEAVPWRCHRSLVADALKHAGCEVLHIVSTAKPSPHRFTPFLTIDNGRLTYPAA